MNFKGEAANRFAASPQRVKKVPNTRVIPKSSALLRAKSRLRRLRYAQRCGARLVWESPG